MDTKPLFAQWNAPSLTRLTLAGLVTATLYVLSAKLGLELAMVNSNVTALWPPSGLALAALVIFGIRLWPALMAGAFIVNLLSDLPLTACAVIATGNTLASVAGALLVQVLVRTRNPVDSMRGVLILIGGSGLLATMISASIGTLTLLDAGQISRPMLNSVWFTWWLGDSGGVILVAPLLLVWKQLPRMDWSLLRAVEAIAMLMCTLLVAQLVFGRNSGLAINHVPLAFLSIIPLAWAAMRFGKHGATACLALIAASATWGTIDGAGPFMRADINESMLLLQLFMGVTTLFTLLFAASLHERRQTQQLLDQYHEDKANSLGEILEHSLNEIYMFEKQTLRFVNVNQGARENLGYTMEELRQMTPVDIKPGYSRESFGKIIEPLLDGTVRRLRFEAELCRKDSSRYPVEVNLQLSRSGSEQVFVAIVLDISERHSTREQLDRLAHHDALTDLPNRLLFSDRLEHALQHQQRTRRQLALLFMDLDGFKRINDTLGHPAGDDLLQQVAGRLLLNSRLYDTIARLGGDEFTVIIEDLDSTCNVPEIAQRILESLAIPFHVNGHEIFLSASIGISMYPQDGKDITSLMKHADIAMFQAKKDGGNKFQFYLEDMTTAANERLALETDLRHALKRNELELHYQPQVSLKTGQIVGLEALLRWHHPQHGLVPPNIFIPVAEESGLIESLGEWVMQSACAQNRAWQEETGINIPVAVNVSGQQINDKLLQSVSEILDATGLEPRYLELEITESCIMNQAAATIDNLCALRKLGVHLSIDDFGTGYSSMSYLKRLPINTLKIDRSFVCDIPGDNNDAAIVEAILALGHTLNLVIVAEGVETEEQRDFLAEHGCDVMQGYLYSRPLPVKEIIVLLSAAKPDLVLVQR